MTQKTKQPIKSFPGYFINQLGEVFSVKSGNNAFISDVNIIKKLKWLKNRNGYFSVCLRRDGKGFRKLVHRLVLETFVGDCPIGYQCRHLDGTRDNNNLDNLRWGTPSQNQQDRWRHGTAHSRPPRGEKNVKAKLNRLQVRIIRKFPEYRGYRKDLSEIFNISVYTITAIKTNKIWKHLI